MSAYPIQYAADYAEPRSRLTTFFRWLLAIPQFIVLFFVGIAVFFSVIIAWFAILFTGKYPEGLYNFNAGALRWMTRVNGYYLLATDKYPPFDLEDHADYPIRVGVDAPLPEYSRLKTGLRLIFGIPVYIIHYALNIVGGLAAFVAWFYILITGKQNDSLQGAINLYVSYSAKAGAYFMLLTEDWPPISASDDDTTATLPVGSPPASGASPTTPAQGTVGSAPESLSGDDPLGS